MIAHLRWPTAFLSLAALCCSSSASAVGVGREITGLKSLKTSYWQPAPVRLGHQLSRPVLVSIDAHGLIAANDCGHYEYVLAQPGERPLADRSPQSGGPVCRRVDQKALRVVDEALRGAASANLRGRFLTLADESGRPALRLARIEPRGIEDRHWSIGAYRDGGELIPVAVPYSSLMFSHGWLTGSPVCGAFMFGSNYRLEERSRLQVSAGYVLAGYCSPSPRRAAAAIMRILRMPLIVEARGSGFALRDRQGEVQIVLTQ